MYLVLRDQSYIVTSNPPLAFTVRPRDKPSTILEAFLGIHSTFHPRSSIYLHFLNSMSDPSLQKAARAKNLNQIVKFPETRNQPFSKVIWGAFFPSHLTLKTPRS